MQTSSQFPQLLDIDFASDNGMELLRALENRHGSRIAQSARLLERLFLLRAAWAPGLRVAGGIVAAPGGPANGTHAVSVAGAGTSIEDALASCIGEAVERVSQFERAGDIALSSSLDEARTRTHPDICHRIEQLLDRSGTPRSTVLDWTPARCMRTGAALLLPADWCLRRIGTRPIAVPGAALSTGAAAGPDFETAASRAVLELIERDAAALWWIGGGRAGVPTLGHATGEAGRLIGSLRMDCRERVTWLLDITTDLGVPVIAALSSRVDGSGVAFGLAARLTTAAAMQAAVMELCQMEIALGIAEARQMSMGAEALSKTDQAMIARARDLTAGACDLLLAARTTAETEPASPETTATSWADLKACLEMRGVDVLLADVTRAEFGIAVVVAVAPSLQLMPSDFQTERVRRTIAVTGGGDRKTLGHSLF